MTLDEISAKSGVPKGTLSKITAGITKAPPLETMRKLVYSMGYTLDDLAPIPEKFLGGDDKKEIILSQDERQLVEDYRLLNDQGQEYIRQTMYMATQTYKKMPDLSNLEKQA